MDSTDLPPGRYSTSDVARALQTTPGAVRNLVYRGRLKRVGGTQRHPQFAAADVAALAAARAERAAA